MREPIWYKDPKNFITFQNYNAFFPSYEMSFEEQLNALMRISIYFSIIVFILKHDINIFFIVVFMGIFTFLLDSVDKQKDKNKELFLKENNLSENRHTKELCTKPTINNPFMNVMMNEYATSPNRKPACNVNLEKTKEEIAEAFNHGLYRDVGDIFSNFSSDRQYVTNPSTTIPNDREKFTKFLYESGPTCKEGSGETCFKLQYSPIVPT